MEGDVGETGSSSNGEEPKGDVRKPTGASNEEATKENEAVPAGARFVGFPEGERPCRGWGRPPPVPGGGALTNDVDRPLTEGGGPPLLRCWREEGDKSLLGPPTGRGPAVRFLAEGRPGR